jgi:hypothetical protein
MAILPLLTSAAKLPLVTAECRPREGDANPSGPVREQAGFEPCPLESARSYRALNQAEPDRVLLEHLP